MSFNGSGTFQINSAGQPVVAGTVITAAAFNALTADLATGLSTCMTKDGQTSATANIPMGNNKFTGLSAGTAATDSTNLGQVQGNVASLISVAGIDTITGSMSPTLTAYTTGAMYWFVAAGTNTGAVTLNIDGLGAKSVTRDGSTALIAGDIVNGQVAVVVYDGTRFQLQKANAFGTLTATTINTTNLTATGTVNLTGATVSNGGSVTTIDINGGTVDGVTIGGASAGAGTFTNLTASGTINFTGATVSNGGSVTTVDINGGTIDGAVIGGASAAAGTFTTATVGAGLVGTPSLTTTGDTNTGLYFPAADTIAATTGGSERMRIDSSGNVGIGTSSPATKLDVNGAVRVNAGASYQWYGASGSADQKIWDAYSDNTAGNPLRFRAVNDAFSNSNTWLQVDRSGFTISSIIFATGSSSERMRIDSSGNVGIGTSSPINTQGTSLHLYNSANTGTVASNTFLGIDSANRNAVLGLNGSATATNSIQFSTTLGTAVAGLASEIANQNLIFRTGGATERMRIDSSGNVGIGTSSPANRLHVKGAWTTNEGQFQIDADSGQQFSGMTIQNNGTYKFIMYNDNTSSWTFLSTASGSNQPLLFGTNETERMRIDSAGNVRIGTAALATTATDGFLYVPTCAGTPTGTPTAITGLAPIVINTTNNKLYFYSGGAWRDAGP